MIFLILAVLPAVILLACIYNKDRVEKEPAGLLFRLFLLGALSTIPAIFFELCGQSVFGAFFNEKSLIYIICENFLVVALAEEGCKYFFLKRTTWKAPAFNYTFDAVVYAVVISLGFATLENIMYVVGEATLGVALMRGILSVPGHAIDGVFMGAFYGAAKYFERRGDLTRKRSHLRWALLVPVVNHGFYDFCLTVELPLFEVIFIIFEIVVTVVALRTVRRLSRGDRPL